VTKHHHYVREWRKFANLTQEQLAERLGVTKGAISRMEQFKRGYNQATLEAVANVLQVRPADLLSAPPTPNDPEAEFLFLARKIAVNREKRKLAANLLKSVLEAA
jgi:transcriptional regulator with XRE-family HTH domain